jgi:hypothetical protein
MILPAMADTRTSGGSKNEDNDSELKRQKFVDGVRQESYQPRLGTQRSIA